MFKLIRNANDVKGKCMIDLVTVTGGNQYVWASVHVDMLYDTNLEQPEAEGISTAYEVLRKADSVDCVLLTVEEFNALVGKKEVE